MFKTRSVSLDQAVQQGQALAAVQLADRLCLDLAHALTGNAKVAAHLFQRAGAAIVQTKTQADDLFLTGGQALERQIDLLCHHGAVCGLAGGFGIFVCNEIACTIFNNFAISSQHFQIHLYFVL